MSLSFGDDELRDLILGGHRDPFGHGEHPRTTTVGG